MRRSIRWKKKKSGVSRPGRITATLLITVLLLLNAPPATAYSVLTHEQIIDFVWERQIAPLLRARYPNATADDLRHAHAFAYGGCLIQDMGYYPFGDKFFSDLAHYVRSGDFVAALLNGAHDVNELAFALGALGHYASDNNGHPTVNASVALEFPKLREKYGDEVTYAESPSAHIQTEFGFDVVQVAKQLYTSQAFHDFIGFEVAQSLLERAFAQTYGLELKDVMSDEERAIGSYRRAVSKWIPELTRVALVTKKKELEALPDFEPRRFRYLLSRTQFEAEWGKNYNRPGFGARVLAFIVKLIPKVGGLRALEIKPPTAETERMYVKSVEGTVKFYDSLLAGFESGQLELPNRDYDTGNLTLAGEYSRADQTYAKLLHRLAKNNFAHVPPTLRSNILSFYADPSRPIETKRHNGEWEKTLRELDLLKAHQ